MSARPSVRQHRLPNTGRIVRVGQIWYDEHSRGHLDPEFMPLANPQLGPFFEAEFISAAFARGWHRGADLVGIFSWRFGRKIPLTGAEVWRLLDQAPIAEVYSFFGALDHGPVWELAERKHPGIAHAAQLLFDRLGMSVEVRALVAPPIYQHHFIAATVVYERFVDGLLAPALDAMAAAHEDELAEALRVDSGYRDRRHTDELLERLFGVPWLPLYPFVAERLFSTWLACDASLRVEALWSGRFVEADQIPHEPELWGGNA